MNQPMELMRELAPLMIGVILPPIVMLAIRASWSGARKFGVSIVPAVILGFFTSLFAGELAAPVPDGLVAILIDTALVYLGSQVAYRLVWKSLLEARLVQRDPQVAPQQVRK